LPNCLQNLLLIKKTQFSKPVLALLHFRAQRSPHAENNTLLICLVMRVLTSLQQVVPEVDKNVHGPARIVENCHVMSTSDSIELFSFFSFLITVFQLVLQLQLL